ncbi:FtsX-like permease family protein [Nocardia terpenica]|uniref:ABC transporter permease n=1 Tax=Nocardia terpenica TaxID=455432 RepID=UPI001892F289|nr:FtsX-like permease family protein [Nocardia terpenica]MBF6064664.1 FtsX-like permease family protein [Nocardia terpenica]MBF6107180.1 FtsX-like permease family protein [Nocardia terpenica]MBF6114938.1 FtsX-like permease family protein [Nocardia terpenica]MBF6122043.1 FtsX-like permease family protein [Nocardia terpenica]MBF6154426.1 FtsX-like permease family protein [Nocardia terpenica]
MRLVPNRVLTRKLGRDLRRRPAQALAVAITVMLGVLMFTDSYDSFRNLSASYEQTYARLHFADLTATGGDPAAIADAVRTAAGVARVTTRTQADVPMTIGGTKLVGRMTGLPSDPASGVDAVALTAGRMPDSAHPDEVVIEHHTADTFGLRAGDRLRVFDGTAWHEVTVSGVVRSPEYLWPARSRQDELEDPHSFAIVFAPEPQALRLTGQPGPDQTLIEMSGAATGADRDRVAARMRAAGAVDVTTRAEQPSDAGLHEDLNGFSEIAVGFPLLFLFAAGIAEYVLITRLVRAERPVIGTLLAMGARRGPLIRHYMGYGVVVAAAGAVAGVLLGAVATSAVTAAYTRAIGIPDTVVEHRTLTAAAGFALGLAAGALAGLAPAVAAARTAPAQAMRGNGTHALRPGPVARLSARWRGLPVVARMALRSLTRDRRRTLATMTGTVLALVLILASVGMVTSTLTVVDVQFGQVDREDATVLAAPGATDPAAHLRSTPGVAAVEPERVAPITVQANGKTYSTALIGLPPDTTMHGFRTVAGQSGLALGGVVAGAALTDQLGVRVGDTLTVTTAFGTPRQVRLTGLVDEPLGTLLYAPESAVESVAPAALPGYLLRFTPGTDRAAIRATVTGLPGVVSYTDTHALETEFDHFLGLFWVFIGVMLALGTILAFTVIYVTMTVNLAERTTELATLCAAGVPDGRLTAALATENLTATALAAPLGIAAGIAVAWEFLRSFNSDMFTLHLSLGRTAPLLAVVAVLTAATLSQIPALRFLRHIDIARVVRERAL